MIPLLLKKELQEYVELEGTELGDYLRLLLELTEYGSYLSPEFARLLRITLEDHLKRFKLDYVITEHTEHVSRTFLTLEERSITQR